MKIKPTQATPGSPHVKIALCDKCSDLVHWEDPEESGGEGGVRGDRDGEYMYIHGWFMSMYDKNYYNTVK